MKSVFISYAHQDREHCTALTAHLRVLEHKGLITIWHDGEITPGSAWQNIVDEKLRNADVIIILVSADFLASSFCQEFEVTAALVQWKARKSIIIPIIVRDCDWQASSLAGFQPLPPQAKPVRQWPDQDQAWATITREIRTLVDLSRRATPLLTGSLCEPVPQLPVVSGLEATPVSLGAPTSGSLSPASAVDTTMTAHNPSKPANDGQEPPTTADEDCWRYEAVPSAALRLYRLSWQLEVWLRTLVYVELRAARLDWEDAVRSYVPDPSSTYVTADTTLPHVTTVHHAALSFLTFEELSRIILDPTNWPLFEPYFPPKRNTEVKLDEIGAVRHRVVYFHEPRPQDDSRLTLFLQELEPGLQRFCHRYAVEESRPDSSEDPVTAYLSKKWHQTGYGIELHRPDGDWLYAPPPYRARPIFHARLRLSSHQKHAVGSPAGLIYRLKFHPILNNSLNVAEFLDSTRALHDDVIHIVLSPVDDTVTVTVPGVYGVERTGDILGAFLYAGRECSMSRWRRTLKRKLDWPQYVLWPSDPLGIYFDGFPGPIFDYE